MKRLLLASTFVTAIVPLVAQAQVTMQSGSAGGLQYQLLVSPSGCSTSRPCQIVEYLHYLGGENAVGSDLNGYFNTPAFWAAHPNTIVIAPEISGSSDTNNWGGVQSGVSPNGQAAVDAVTQIEMQYATDPNSVVVTGGSMGGIGTEALLEEFGPHGTSGQHIYAAGLAYDGAVYNSDPATQTAALCGVPLIIQHGSADETVNPGPDQTLAQTLAGCFGFQYVQADGAGHGTWGNGYSDGAQLSRVMTEAASGANSPASADAPAIEAATGVSPSGGTASSSTGSTAKTPGALPIPSVAVAAPISPADVAAVTAAPSTSSDCSTPVPAGGTALQPSLIPPGYLRTSGNQIVDAAGEPVRIASVGWFQNFDNPETSMQQMVLAGFNTVRIEWFDASLQSRLSAVDSILPTAAKYGVKIILDHHADEGGGACDSQQVNGLWIDSGPGTDGTDGCGHQGTVTAARFLQDWVTVAQHYAGNTTVIGFDLDNEPLAYNGMATWGDGGATDIRAMYQAVGNAILAVNPGVLIIAEGPQNWGGSFAGSGAAPEGDLTMAASKPVTLSVPDKVVYSVHEYPQPGISGGDHGTSAIQRMNNAWGYLVTQNVAPVWIGEMGGSLDGQVDSGADLNDELAWAATIVPYLNGQDGPQGGPTFTGSQQGISTSWWAWGDLSGETPDGTMSGTSLRQGQWNVYSQLRQNPICGRPYVAPVGLTNPTAAQTTQATSDIEAAIQAPATSPTPSPTDAVQAAKQVQTGGQSDTSALTGGQPTSTVTAPITTELQGIVTGDALIQQAKAAVQSNAPISTSQALIQRAEAALRAALSAKSAR
jgi:endoglucanase